MTNDERKDIVLYRLENAKNTLAEVLSHIENGFYNTAVNRMYYACYYAVSALLVANGIQVKSHEGVRQQLGLHFVLTGKISKEQGQFYSMLFSKRTAGDYEDFLTHNKETADSLYPRCVEFISQVESVVIDSLKSL